MTHQSVLIVDDEDAILRLMRRFFERLRWIPYLTQSPQEAVALFETVRPPLVILDLHMPILSGIDLLEILRDRDPDPSIIMLTGRADVETAVTAMRLGAHNYLTKPLALDHLEVVAQAALEHATLRRRNRLLLSQQGGRSPTAEALQRSSAMRSLEAQINHLAESDATVLVLGETGTGKSWLARQIHRRSGRASASFIEVDCAGLSEENLEQRLFGVERMTSRGKRVEPTGVLELADGGTVVLDQIEMLDFHLQPRLLSVLETQRFRRVGGTTEIPVSIRIIATTARDLEEEVREGRFREDLYYRLAVVPLRLPPLREQSREETLAVAQQLVQSLGQKREDLPPLQITPEAEDLLTRYRWPGNVREMRNVLERILILRPGAREIRAADLPPEIRGESHAAAPTEYTDPTLPLEEVERRHILAALQHFQGNKSRVAQHLRIGRRTLYEKLTKYGLS